MTAHSLELLDLCCARGDRPLFSGLHQEIKAGELLYVVGANGSGKTTLLRTLCGLSRPAQGEVRWRGTAIEKLGEEYRRELAYVGHKDAVQVELTPLENLRAASCRSDSSARIDDALERLGLAAYASFPARILSQGQKRRLALARLLIAAKPLWILDEPFTALDAATCEQVAEIISAHIGDGGIGVLSSHQTFDVAKGTVKRLDLDKINRKAVTRTGARSASSQHYSA